MGRPVRRICWQIAHSAREINVRCYRTQRATAEEENKEGDVRIYFLSFNIHRKLKAGVLSTRTPAHHSLYSAMSSKVQ